MHVSKSLLTLGRFPFIKLLCLLLDFNAYKLKVINLQSTLNSDGRQIPILSHSHFHIHTFLFIDMCSNHDVVFFL